MYTWVYYMKAIAAVLITNSHYGNIWPISAMACGGLLGDVIYFAISGFCLYNIKNSFGAWYKKRIGRIYPTLWIVTVLAVLIGYLQVSSVKTFIQYFVYPTYYHFIKSIMFLYLLFYFVMIINKKYKIGVHKIITVTVGIYLLIYIFAYDKSYYHIDVVEEWMIQFVFFTAMLIGAWFRENIHNEEEKILSKKTILATGCLIICYFASKLILSRSVILSNIQIFNTLILLITLFFLLKVSVAMENKKCLILKKVESFVKFIANITLEIYLVQYLIFYLVPDIIFPINFIVVTVGIVLLAFVVNKLTDNLRKVKIRG